MICECCEQERVAPPPRERNKADAVEYVHLVSHSRDAKTPLCCTVQHAQHVPQNCQPRTPGDGDMQRRVSSHVFDVAAMRLT